MDKLKRAGLLALCISFIAFAYVSQAQEIPQKRGPEKEHPQNRSDVAPVVTSVEGLTNALKKQVDEVRQAVEKLRKLKEKGVNEELGNSPLGSSIQTLDSYIKILDGHRIGIKGHLLRDKGEILYDLGMNPPQVVREELEDELKELEAQIVKVNQLAKRLDKVAILAGRLLGDFKSLRSHMQRKVRKGQTKRALRSLELAINTAEKLALEIMNAMRPKTK